MHKDRKGNYSEADRDNVLTMRDFSGEPAIQEILPSSDAPIRDFGTAGMTVGIRYEAIKDLGEIPLNMVQQNLRTKLGMPDLILKTERTRPPNGARASRAASDERKRP